MVTAYVMVKSLSGEADRIRDEISTLDGVTEVHIVAGDVDLIAKLQVDSTEDVKAVAAEGIHEIEGVDGTQTYIAMD